MQFGLYVILWCFCGYVLLRRVLNVEEGVLIVPLAPAVGYILFTLLNNIALHIFPPRLAFIIVPVVIMFLTVFVIIRFAGSTTLQWTVNRSEVTQVFVACILLFPMVFGSFQGWFTWDVFDHNPRAVLISQIGLPVNSYTSATTCPIYHYAQNMNAGVLFGVMQTTINSADEFLALFTLYVALALCTVFVWELMGRQRIGWGIVGSIAFLFVSQASWLVVIVNLPGVRLLREYASAFRIFDELGGFSIEAWLARPLIYTMQGGEEQAFWLIGFTVLIGWFHLDDENPKWQYAGLGIVTALTALVYITGMPLIAITIGIWLLTRVWVNRRQPKRSVLNLLLFSSLTLFIVGVQGGLVTATLFCRGDQSATSETLTTVGFQFVPSYSVVDETVAVTSFENVLRFVYDWGVVFFLFPFVLMHYLRERQWRPVVLLSVAGSIALIPFFITFGFSPANMARFTTMLFWLTAAMSAPWLASFWHGRKFHSRLFVIVILIMMIATGVHHLLITFLVTPTNDLVLDPLDEIVQEEWLGVLEPTTNAVWDPSTFENEISKGIGRSVIVFGTYSCIVEGYTWDRPDILPEWSTSLNPNLLLERGCNYLYIDQAWYNELPPQKQQILNNPEQYVLVQEWIDGSDFRRLYQVLEGD